MTEFVMTKAILEYGDVTTVLSCKDVHLQAPGRVAEFEEEMKRQCAEEAVRTSDGEHRGVGDLLHLVRIERETVYMYPSDDQAERFRRIRYDARRPVGERPPPPEPPPVERGRWYRIRAWFGVET